MEPKVSILVLTYNNFNYLKSLIWSILNQTYSNIEVVLCDDYSKNFPLELISEIVYLFNMTEGKSIQILHAKENRGTVKNINEGIKAATGEYIKIIAADDFYPDFSTINTQMEHIIESGKDIVVSQYADIDNNVHIANDARTALSNILLPTILKMDFIAGENFIKKYDLFPIAVQSCLYKKSFFEKYGYFNENYRLIEDVEMSQRIRSLGNVTTFVNIISVYHRSDTGISKRKNKVKDSSKKYYDIDTLYMLNEQLQYMSGLNKIGQCIDINYFKLTDDHKGILLTCKYLCFKYLHLVKSLIIRIRRKILFNIYVYCHNVKLVNFGKIE